MQTTITGARQPPNVSLFESCLILIQPITTMPGDDHMFYSILMSNCTIKTATPFVRFHREGRGHGRVSRVKQGSSTESGWSPLCGDGRGAEARKRLATGCAAVEWAGWLTDGEKLANRLWCWQCPHEQTTRFEHYLFSFFPHDIFICHHMTNISKNPNR